MRQIPFRSPLQHTMHPIRAGLWVVIYAALLAVLILPACTRERPSASNSRQAAHAPFDYYLLALSWAPNFCATHSGGANECGIGRHTAFVVHGLWPQNEQGRLDQPCQSTPPVAAEVVRYALNFYPDAGLIQHEWRCHGVYSGLSARNYFSAVGRAYQSLHLPPAITGLTHDTEANAATLALQFEQANSAPEGSFVSSCHNRELVAIEACFTRDLKLRSCAPGLRSCSGPLLLRAPR